MSEQNQNLPSSADIMAHKFTYMEREIRDLKTDVANLEREVITINRFNDRTDLMQGTIKDAVSEMKTMMTTFIDTVNAQNTKIDQFINSERRAASKKDLIVSTVQAIGAILLTLATLWAAGVI